MQAAEGGEDGGEDGDAVQRDRSIHTRKYFDDHVCWPSDSAGPRLFSKGWGIYSDHCPVREAGGEVLRLY